MEASIETTRETTRWNDNNCVQSTMTCVDKAEAVLVAGVQIGLLVTLTAAAINLALTVAKIALFLFTGGSFAALTVETITSMASIPIISTVVSVAFSITVVLTAILAGLVFAKCFYSLITGEPMKWDNWKFLKIT